MLILVYPTNYHSIERLNLLCYIHTRSPLSPNLCLFVFSRNLNMTSGNTHKHADNAPNRATHVNHLICLFAFNRDPVNKNLTRLTSTIWSENIFGVHATLVNTWKRERAQMHACTPLDVSMCMTMKTYAHAPRAPFPLNINTSLNTHTQTFAGTWWHDTRAPLSLAAARHACAHSKTCIYHKWIDELYVRLHLAAPNSSSSSAGDNPNLFGCMRCWHVPPMHLRGHVRELDQRMPPN